MLRASVQLSLVACCIFSDAMPAAAQFIRGRVVHATTEAPLGNVSIELLGDDSRILARSVTDTAGRFHMQASRIGEYRLRAQRIGLEPVTAPLLVEVSQRVEIVLRMAEAAVPIEPLTVEGRRALNIGSLAGYYQRIQRAQLLGIGTIMTRDWLEDRNASTVGDILRQQPRVSVSSAPYDRGQVRFDGNRGCIPHIYLDGILANRTGPMYVNELPRPADLEGIEIYRGLAEMGEYYDNTGCGVILLWTRRSGDDAPPFTLRRMISFGVALGIISLLISNF